MSEIGTTVGRGKMKSVVIDGWVREVRETHDYEDGNDDSVLITKTRDEEYSAPGKEAWQADYVKEGVQWLSGREFAVITGDKVDWTSDEWSHDTAMACSGDRKWHHPKKPIHLRVKIEITEQ
jgi:hypothetical protein